MKKNFFYCNLVLLITHLFATLPVQAASESKDSGAIAATLGNMDSLPGELIAGKILPFLNNHDLFNFGCSTSATTTPIRTYIDQIKHNPDFAGLNDAVQTCIAQLIIKREIISHDDGHYGPISAAQANQICTHAYLYFPADNTVLDACWELLEAKIIENQMPFCNALDVASSVMSSDRVETLRLFVAAEAIEDIAQRELTKMAIRIMWRLRNNKEQIHDALELDHIPMNEIFKLNKNAAGNTVIILDFADLLPLYPDATQRHSAIEMIINLVTTRIDRDETLLKKVWAVTKNSNKNLECTLHLRNLGDYTVPNVISLKLNSLVLNDNHITSLDTIITPSLTMLAACNNQLTNIDRFNACTLTKLFLSGNQLENFYFFKAPALTELYATHNMINTLDGLHAEALKFLDVSDNHIENFDNMNTPCIEAVHANNNAINSLSGLCINALRVLSLNNNRVTSLATLNDAAQLTHLYANNNTNLTLRGFTPRALNCLDVRDTRLTKGEVIIFTRDFFVGNILDAFA
jgi:hypothetical protein